jgi:FkbM family methyltransferase
MIPGFLDRILSDIPGEAGAYYNAYKTYRWGDPYLRLIASLADRSRLAIDVGAHFGDYTFFMRRHSAGCIAFECNPLLAARLRRRFGRSVDIRSDAVSDRTGETVLRIPQSAIGLGRATIETSNTLSEFSEVEMVTVRTVRLDDTVDRLVGLIKIDVEGHELSALRGATRLLSQHRPNLLLELEDRHSLGCVAAAFDFLSGFGYRGFYLRHGALVPVEPGRPLEAGLWNFVFKYAPDPP